MTAPTSRRPRPPIVLHRARGLIADDHALPDGIPATALPRTLLDCAATTRFDLLERMVERAEELQLFDLRQIDSLLARTVGHPGVGRLRKAIALYRPPAFSRSKLERRFLRLALKAGLPRPATGFNECGYELDFYWPEKRFAVELDTYETHGTHGAFERDRLRHEDLTLVGVEMVRVTGRRLEYEPQRVIARVTRLLAQRRPDGAGGAPDQD